MDLKDQMIHQMVTLEQYLNVAYMWQEEKEESFNPYEDADSMYNQTMFGDVENKSMRDMGQSRISMPVFDNYKNDD